MAKYIYTILSALLLIGLVSCDKEKSSQMGQGYLYLGVEKNLTMVTKAVNPTMSVAVLDAAEDTVKYFADFDKELGGEGVLLDAGAYQVVVSAGKIDSAAWELPYFYGKTDCEIVANQVTSAKVTCKIANTKVTVDYSDDFKKYFTDFSTMVSNTSGSLTYEMDETRGGFFAPEPLKTKLQLTNKDGEVFELNREYPDVQERYHYTLRFKLEGDPEQPDDSGEAGGKFDITVEEKADTVIVTIPVPVEDLEAIKAPAFKLEGFDEKNILEYRVEKAPENKLKLIAGNGIERLNVIVESEQLNGLGIFSFNLMSLDAEMKEKLNSISFPEGETGEADTLIYDLTAMANALKSNEEHTQTHRFTFTVRDNKSQEVSTTLLYSVKPDVPVVTNAIPLMGVWTTFTTFSGNTDDNGEYGFEYKKASESDESWKSISVSTKNEKGTFTALVKDLEAHTKYQYRAICHAEGEELRSVGNVIEFTTDYANADDSGKPFVPNLGFDDWNKDGKTWYAGTVAEISAGDVFWDSGNKGTSQGLAAIAGAKNPTSPEDYNGGKIACLQSQYVGISSSLGQFAAGNLYTGQFQNAFTSGTLGALIQFGRPFTSRPTQLTGLYKYTPKKVDNGGYKELQKGEMDKCSIYIALTDNEGLGKTAYEIDTREGKFVDFSEKNPNIIAYGSLSEEEAVGAANWTQFTIDLKYRDTTRKPKYIIIVASASKYGDYFTGGDGSTMYIDEFELQYDYNPASFVGTDLEGLTE